MTRWTSGRTIGAIIAAAILAGVLPIRGDGRDVPVALCEAARPPGEVPLRVLRRRRRQGQRLHRRHRRGPRQREVRHDHSTRWTSAPRGTRPTTGATPTTGRGSGRAGCSRAGSGSSTWPRDPAKPRIEKVLEDIPSVSGLSGPHTYYALPGRMLISFLGSGGRRIAGGAGRVHQRRQVHPPDRESRDGALRLRRRDQAVAEPDGQQQLHPAAQLPQAAGADGPEGLRQGADRLGLQGAAAAPGRQGGPRLRWRCAGA